MQGDMTVDKTPTRHIPCYIHRHINLSDRTQANTTT
ncbi:hypothetical protein OYT1_ch0160 [Ferriphaselus amnicola]|uniref:Uncharacterized protein n=1 Tax=Ferriphaselus amnicola TaxID=1188319 RepID=A0A2Z6G8K8_9PROT|nr:hypothetical protein OYT1_ch0160 [Ferriphaselus amnicola]